MAKRTRKTKTNTRALMNEFKYGSRDPKVIMELETKDDAKFFKDANLNWKDIEEQDRNLVIQSTRVASELIPMAEDQEVIENLGERKELFLQAFRTFKRDFEKFLIDLEKIKDKWEGKQGPIKTMEDFSLYNLVASEYHDINLRFVSLAQLSSSTIAVEAMQAMQRARAKEEDEENNIEEGFFTEIEEAQKGELFTDEKDQAEKERLDA